MNQLTADFFTLFALPSAFRISPAALEERYLALQREAHPDRFAGADEKTRRLSVQLAARINEGYQTLKQPLSRALYLLQHLGCDAGLTDSSALPAEFLLEQMECREAVARASGNAPGLQRILESLGRDLENCYETLGRLLDDKQDYPAAADLAQRLMFLEKLRHDADEAMFDLQDGNRKSD